MIRLQVQPFCRQQAVRARLAGYVLEGDRFSCGPLVAQFELELAAWQGRTRAVCFNSGSSANLALIQAMLNVGLLKRGDSVGYSAVTWATNVMPLLQLGLDPVAVDVEADTLNVSTRTLRECPREFRALFLTHALGFCGDTDGIRRWCANRKILLIEDACEALGSVDAGGHKLGNLGLASTFSFFVGHHISTIEGGMVCTDDEQLDEMLRMVRSHGWAREVSPATRRRLETGYEIDLFRAPYTFYTLGFNLRPTEITGLIGLEQLPAIGEVLAMRHANFCRMARAAAADPEIIHLRLEMETVSNFAFPVVCRDETSFRRHVDRFLPHAEIRPIIGGSMPDQPFMEFHRAQCPNAQLIHRCGFYVPNRHDLTEAELDLLCRLLAGETI